MTENKTPEERAAEAYAALTSTKATEAMDIIEKASWELGNQFPLFQQELMRLISQPKEK